MEIFCEKVKKIENLTRSHSSESTIITSCKRCPIFIKFSFQREICFLFTWLEAWFFPHPGFRTIKNLLPVKTISKNLANTFPFPKQINFCWRSSWLGTEILLYLERLNYSQKIYQVFLTTNNLLKVNVRKTAGRWPQNEARLTWKNFHVFFFRGNNFSFSFLFSLFSWRKLIFSGCS